MARRNGPDHLTPPTGTAPARPAARVPLFALLILAGIVGAAAVDVDRLRQQRDDLASTLPVAAAANAALALAAAVIRGVATSGAIAGAVVGTAILLTMGWAGWAVLAWAFVLAAGTTWWGRETKERLGIAEDRRGRRSAANVLANTGLAAVLAVVAGSRPDDPVWTVAFVAALAAAASDTVASEVGKAAAGGTFLVTTLARVPAGTTGAVSVAGTSALVLAGMTFGILASLTQLAGTAAAGVAVAVAVISACFAEAVVAIATEDQGILDNDGVNVVTSALGALFAAGLVGLFG